MARKGSPTKSIKAVSVIIALVFSTAIFGLGVAGAAEDPLVAETTLGANCTIDNDSTSQNDPEGDDISYLGSDTNGASSAASQSLRAFNHAEFAPPPPSGIFGEDCSMSGGFENQFAVDPGSTGLSPGTLVTLQLTLRLDGSTDGWGTGNEGWYSHTENGMSYLLQDSTVPCVPNGEGCTEVYSARFSAGNELERQASVPHPSFDTDGHIDESYSYDWTLDSNRGTHLGASDFDFTILCPTYPCEPVICPGLPCDLGATKEFDTGSQTVLFDTKVGAVISIDAGINTFTQAYGPGPSDSLADFSDTFTSAITPAAGFGGLVLRFATDAPSADELCDGIDNDDDGDVDEGFTDTNTDGTADCVDDDDDGDGHSDAAEQAAGSNPLLASSTPEICDGIDNDGNEGIDEGFTDCDDPEQLIRNLMAEVDSSGIHKGLRKDLSKKLSDALKALEKKKPDDKKAIHKLDEFIKKVLHEANKNKPKIVSDFSKALHAAAMAIIASIRA